MKAYSDWIKETILVLSDNGIMGSELEYKISVRE